MGNIVDSLLSGFAKVIADILAEPLQFLSGNACRFIIVVFIIFFFMHHICSSVCGSTWDLICYIQNFCLANLGKMAAMLFLLYLVLLFFYLIYKVGICSCVRSVVCSCVSCCFSACHSACTLACNKMRNIRRAQKKRRRRDPRCDIEDCYSRSIASSESEDTRRHCYAARSSCSERSLSGRSARDRRKVYLERSLRPINHRIMVSHQPAVVDKKELRVNNHRHQRELCKIKVTRTSRFVHKGSGRRIDNI